MINVFIERGSLEISLHRGKTEWKPPWTRQGEKPWQTLQSQPSEDPTRWDLSLGLLAPELWDNRFLLFKAPACGTSLLQLNNQIDFFPILSSPESRSGGWRTHPSRAQFCSQGLAQRRPLICCWISEWEHPLIFSHGYPSKVGSWSLSYLLKVTQLKAREFFIPGPASFQLFHSSLRASLNKKKIYQPSLLTEYGMLFLLEVLQKVHIWAVACLPACSILSNYLWPHGL